MTSSEDCKPGNIKEKIQFAIQANRFMSWAIGRLWLNKSTEQITREYNIITVSFLVIAFFLYFGIAGPLTWWK
jgi:hypothetical protein